MKHEIWIYKRTRFSALSKVETVHRKVTTKPDGKRFVRINNRQVRVYSTGNDVAPLRCVL